MLTGSAAHAFLMKIECFFSEMCGAYHQLRQNLDQALTELRLQAEVVYTTVYYDEAVEKGIRGSPTVRINGKDIDEAGGDPGIT